VAAWIMLPLAGVAIASGLALARTQSAKFRPDSVRAKLLITLTLAAALVVVVAPGLADEAARAHAGVIGGNPAYAVSATVSAATLLVVNLVLGTSSRHAVPSRTSECSTISEPGGSERLTTKPNSHGEQLLPGFRHDALLPLYDVVQRLAGIPALHTGD
jgi:hypothetical protein